MRGEIYRSASDGENEFIYVEGVGFADPLLGAPRRNRIRIYANAVGYALLTFLALQNFAPLLVVAAMRVVHPAIRIYNNRFLASRQVIEMVGVTSSLICYLVPLALLLTVLRIPLRTAFPLRRSPAGEMAPCVGLVLASSAVGSSISMVLSAALSLVGLHPSGPDIAIPDSVPLLLLTVLSSAVMPAIFEELLFRGVLMQSMRRFGDLFALTVSTLLFGLMHRNLVQLPNALLTGLVLGFLVLRTGSLRVSMLCHFINNLVPLLLGMVSVVLPAETVNIVYLSLNFIYIVLGIAALIYLCYARSYLFRPLRGEGRRAERYKYSSFFSSVPMAVVLVLLGTMILLNMFL